MKVIPDYHRKNNSSVIRLKNQREYKVLFVSLLLLFLQLPLNAADYYWVGGTGNWSDISHWATTSGGSIKYTLPPTAVDNVHFDGSSGFTSTSKTVTVNQNSFCNNIIWNGSAIPPTFTVSNTLQVNGSLQFQPGMTVNGSPNNATITFTGSLPNQTITTGNIAVNIPFTFNGTGGWILQDSLKLLDGYNLSFTRGDLDFNGQYVKMGYFAGAATSGTLKIANSTIYVTGSWTYNTTGSTPITAANSVNSQIFINLISMATKANDVYYNVTLANTNNNANISGGGIFNCVTFLNGGTIRALTADSLILMGAKVYNILDNNIIINKYFEANLPSCSGLIELIGAGTIKMGTGTVVDVANARIQNVTIQGPDAPYTASSSIDLGGNTGWSFTAPIAQTYYWVGGGGNWNDVSHWASSSGGAPGSGCVPLQLDNVVFDANSGFGTITASKTVTLNGNAYCNNMTWNGAPNNPILSVSNSLQINASLELQPGMTTTGNSTRIISFTTTLPNQTITTNGVIINAPITFNGTGGWNLQDSLKIPNQQVTFTNGNLNFNGQYAIMNNFSSSGGINSRTLNIANSTIDVAYPGWTYTGGVPLTAPSTANSEIRVITTAATVNAKSVDVYNNVTFLNSYYVQSGISNGIYNKVSVLGGNGLNINATTSDSLVLKSIGKYLITSNTNSIKEYFEASPPPCSGLIELMSSTAGSQRTITMAAGSVVNVSNCRIQDIRITGATPYTAAGSIDLGNNSGWIFTAPDAHTYYWVGGSGNWNDGNHWASSSGGTPGSGCVPTQYDNVIFDGGSGFLTTSKTVTVDGSAYCDSITWAGSAVPPTFIVNQALQVNGSFKLQPNMTFTLNSSVTYTSSRPNETISTANVVIGGNSNGLTFNGTGGWQLVDSLKLNNNSITFTKGNLDFNGQYIKLNNFTSTSTSSRTLNIANATIDVLGNWSYTNAGSAALTTATSANSFFRFSGSASSLTADADDVYNNVEYSVVGTSIITRGTYGKITAIRGSIRLNAITTDTLIYAPGGSTNTFTSGTTSIINKLWITNGTPCLPTTIQSVTGGAQANISMPKTAANVLPDTVLLDFVRIRDLNAITGSDRAILKKGSQSIDNSGYGMSGNNSNWFMAPYAGAAGFDGLGPDIAQGCQSLSITIGLDPIYRPDSNGSYEWRINNINGPVIGTGPELTVTQPGNYYLKTYYDIGKTCSLTDSKNIVTAADSLIWTGLAGTSDWNNPTNWRKPDGTSDATTIPRACTDVLISSGAGFYPSLDLTNTSRSLYPDAACRNIHFDSGAEVAFTDSLHYEKAYVDLTLQRDKWYMLSAPLKDMYSGDYWLAPWGVTTASGSVYNRNNPRVYMQQYQLQNPETGYYPGSANWSMPFNTLDVKLGIGFGFLTGIDGAGSDMTLKFPRPETQYEYFYKSNGYPSGTWTTQLSRTNSFRMFLEPGFAGTMPVVWDSTTRSTIIIGNPFMSHLSFTALQAGNPGVIGNTYYVWTGTSFDAFTVIGDQTTKTDWTSLTIDQIPPMQSFIVEKQTPVNVITNININSGMSVSAPGFPLRSNDVSNDGINLEVFRGNSRQSGATLSQDNGKNVLTMFSATVLDAAVVYFVENSKPYSILNTVPEKTIEIGIRTTDKGNLKFRFNGMENLPNETQVILEDRLLKTSQDVKAQPQYTFNNNTGDISGRFFLRITGNITGIEDLGKESGIRIYAAENNITVNSGQPIRIVEAYDLQGKVIYRLTGLNDNNLSFSLDNIKQPVIIKVITDTGVKTEKVILK